MQVMVNENRARPPPSPRGKRQRGKRYIRWHGRCGEEQRGMHPEDMAAGTAGAVAGEVALAGT